MNSFLTENSVKLDEKVVTTNEYSLIDLGQYGYTPRNTLATYIIDGIPNANVVARLYNYNDGLMCRIVNEGSGAAYNNTPVRLIILHI